MCGSVGGASGGTSSWRPASATAGGRIGVVLGFELRNQRTLRSFVKVLKAAKVDFAVLGLEERDSGDVARRLGDEATFQLLADPATILKELLAASGQRS